MINFSAIDYRSRFGKTLRLPLKLLPGSFVMPIVSGPIKGMKWQVGTSDHGCWLGTYELAKLKEIERWLRPGMTVYDIGANAGIYTLFFSRAVGPEGRVFAFEPLGENSVNLLHHIQLNRLENVVLTQAALASCSAMSSFQLGSIGNSMGKLTTGNTQLRVPTVSMDELITKHNFPLPDLIKMDVEGAESEVLCGASALLSQRATVWFIALHGDQQKELCQNVLTSYGYRIFSMDGEMITAPLVNSSYDEIYALPPAEKSSSEA